MRNFEVMSARSDERVEELGRLIESRRTAIFAFFRRRLRDVGDAEDATQEVLANVLRRSDLSEVRNVEAYLFQAAANHLRDRARRAAARPRLESEAANDAYANYADEITPERDLLGREAYQRVIETLRELPERSRTIFILNRYEDMSGRQIAQRLGISQRAVEKHISRVLATLRERLS